jgi:hypothetical protein
MDSCYVDRSQGYTLRRQPKSSSFLRKCVTDTGHSFSSGLSNYGIQRAESLFIPKSSCNIFNTVGSDISTCFPRQEFDDTPRF